MEAQAVAQHYGYRSFFVDVTLDPTIALWFALHEFKAESTPLHVDKWLRSAVFQWARYFSCPSGFMYLILIPEGGPENRFTDLTEVMPIEATRIHVQRAGSVSVPRDSISIDDLVAAKVRIIDDGWFRNSNQNVPFGELFPSPSHDQFYRSLCTIPYAISSDAKVNIAYPLLGLFPLYAESIYELAKEYLPLTKVLTTARPALEWNVISAVAELEEVHFKAADATRILLLPLMIERALQDERVDNSLNVSLWPSHNMLLEFDYEFALDPSIEGLQVTVGSWIIVGQKSILVAEMVDTFEDVQIGHKCVYSLPDLKLITKECSCPECARILLLFQKASHLLDRQVAILRKDKLGYLLLDYKESSDLVEAET